MCFLSVKQEGQDSVGSYMEMMDALVSLEDTMYDYRVNHLLSPKSGVILLIKSYRKSHAQFSWVCIKYLITMLLRYPHFVDTMKAKRAQWFWMDQWLYVITFSIFLPTFLDSIFFLKLLP